MLTKKQPKKNPPTTDQKKIAYCGLYCEDCFAHQGKIADLARDLRKELRQTKFKRYAKELSKLSFFKEYKDYDKCYEVLGAMVRFRCKRVCRDGGGNPYCKIRSCCKRKGYQGCWECDEIDKCKKLDSLNSTHLDAHRNNLKLIKKSGAAKFVKGKRFI